MSNLTDRDWLKRNISNRSTNINTMRRTEFFPERSAGLESSFFANNTTKNGLTVLPRSSNVNSFKVKEMNSLFKVPHLDNFPGKRTTIKSIISPRRRVESGRVKNDLKSNQPKLSFLPRPSFISARNSIHCSRLNQRNARKELIKKMVLLAESSLKESRGIKQSSPVKVLAGLTPKKTAGSGSYLVLPELNKKVPRVEDIRSPIQDFIRKKTFAYSAKPIPFAEMNNKSTYHNPSEENKTNFTLELKQELKESTNIPLSSAKYSQILCHCRIYNTEVNSICGKLKSLDESFEENLQNLSDYKVYKEFCAYQSKKEELYNELQCLEEELKTFVKTHTSIGEKLNDYIKNKRELFMKQNVLHQDFEKAISAALEKYTSGEEVKQENKCKEETPKLRRSLRLSKVDKKMKVEERTPMTRKLKKLDSKSKGIWKSAKLRSP